MQLFDFIIGNVTSDLYLCIIIDIMLYITHPEPIS